MPDEEYTVEHEEPDGVRGRLLAVVTSLQFKATSLVVVLTLCVTAAASGYFVRSSIKLAREQRDEQLVELAALLAKSAASRCAEGDSAALTALASEAANSMPLLYVVFTDAEGRELAAVQHESVDLPDVLRNPGKTKPSVVGRPILRSAGKGNQPVLDVAYPINLQAVREVAPGRRASELVGYVRTGMAPNRWFQTMASKLDLVMGVGSIATCMAIVLGSLLVRRIVSPIESLAHAMLEFSEGNLDTRSPVRRRDEIGNLVTSFNRMADQHQRTHQRIVRLNAELEERVAKRTQQLRELAARDPLTGLYNRRYFSEVLDRSFSEAVRYERDLSCLMLDLDDFKDVNDSFGHQVGDRLIMLMATTIVSDLRAPDVAARYGGDEFIVLLPQTDAERAGVLAARIIERFAQAVQQEFPRIRTSISLGIASLNCLQAPDAESLIRSADHALYEAKSAGKDRIVTATTLTAPACHLVAEAAPAGG